MHMRSVMGLPEGRYGPRERVVMGLESGAVSAPVTKHFFLVKHVIKAQSGCISAKCVCYTYYVIFSPKTGLLYLLVVTHMLTGNITVN